MAIYFDVKAGEEFTDLSEILSSRVTTDGEDLDIEIVSQAKKFPYETYDVVVSGTIMATMTVMHRSEKLGMAGFRIVGFLGLRSAVIPPLVGLHEAAEILGWDKRKVSTYRGRGVFPRPIIQLNSGPIWTREQIERYRDSKGGAGRVG